MQKILKERAKLLRKNSTKAERLLWYQLRGRQLARYKFKRQYIIAPYIVDFVCLWKSLIIELDGGQHSEQLVYDQKRANYLKSKGFKVLRFWNNQMLQETDAVLETIYLTLAGRASPHP